MGLCSIFEKEKQEDKRQMVLRLKDKPCLDCGHSYPHYVMDFDHVRGLKDFSIGGGLGFSREQILAEIEKCDLVCANCHRKRTHERGQHKVLRASRDRRLGTDHALSTSEAQFNPG